MKKFTTFIVFFLLSITALFAQVPEKFTYQAVVRNASNALVTNLQVGVRVSILQGSSTGSTMYVETHITTTNANGLLSVEIGSGTVQQGSFAEINWADGPYFLKTETDPNGGNDYSVTSVQQLLSVPYALYAKEAANAFSGDYNDLTNQPVIPTVPTNVSAFDNDAGYLTSYTEQQILTISNDTIFLTGGSFVKLPAGFDGDYNSLMNKPEPFSGDYNDLTNQPTIPTVPTNVSAFTNDAGYLTSFTEQQVLSLSHDTLFLTGGSFVKLPGGFDGDYNSLTNKPELFSGDYNDLTNKPTIPTVPTNVSAFTNDAGYITMDSIPTIPTVPTYVSAFTNDVGYLTSFTEQQVLSLSHDTLFLTGGSFVKLPESFDGDYNSLTNKPELFSGDYNDLTNQPTIPVVPTNVSVFTNDAGYLTSFTEQQVLSLSHDTLFLTGGSFVKLPAGFDGDYNSLMNKPTIPTVPTNISAFTNDAGYLTSYTETDPQFNAWDKDYNDLTNTPTIPTVPTNVSAFTNDAGYLTSFTEQQVLSLSHDTLFLTGGSFVKLPAGFDGDYNSLTNKPELFSGDYNDLENVPQIPQIPADVSAFNNDAGYITEASCNGMNICEMFNGLEALQSQVDSLQQSLHSPETQSLPSTVITAAVSDITESSATSGGNVTSDGGSVVSAKGVCWNTTGSPTISDNHTIDGGGMGAFESNMHGLSTDTTYYVRAYATNSAGTIYGSQVSFTIRENQSWDGTGINPNDGFPCQRDAMVTDHVGNVYNTMQIGSQCWMRENLRQVSGNEHFYWPDVLQACPTGWHLPDYEDWTTLGDYMGFLNSNAPSSPVNFGDGYYWTSTTMPWPWPWESDDENPPTLIYWTYIQTNSVDIGANEVQDAGNNLSVRCLRDGSVITVMPPTVVTVAVSGIAASSATCGGDVNSDGGSEVSAKGVCWNTTGSPTLSDNHTIDGGGMGTFESTMHGLSINTTYYVRAYATNSAGTSYGSEVSFTSTAQSLPSTVMTAAVPDIMVGTSATCGGNVTSDGGSVVSAKGVCWNTTGNPTISDNHTIDGGGMGAFKSNMHGLFTDTTYYVRAYATNSAGTSYGSQMSFTIREYQSWDGTGLNPNDGLPCQGGAMVTDHVGNVYNTMQIGNQCWMRENLRDASGNEHIYWPDVLQACPTGWHLPDYEDWNTFGNYMGFQSGNAPSSPVIFGDGSYWTSTINTDAFSGMDVVWPIILQSNTITNGISGGYFFDVHDAGYILSVRCVRGIISPTPTVTTAVVSDIAATSVTCSANVTSDGGSVVSAKGICWNTTGNPTLSDNHTIAGGGVGGFESTLHGLAVGITYYVRAYATNSGGTSYSNQIVFNFHGGYQTWDGTGLNPNDAFACQGVPTVTDHEGNIYNTVQIGNQCWTRENMRCTTSPSTGTTILENPADSISYTGKKAYYVNGSADNTAIYGLLYNWNAAVDTFNTAFGETSTNTNKNYSVDVTFSGPRRGICPVGWHVPSNAEWTAMTDYVTSQSVYTCGGNTNEAKALASTIWNRNPEADSCAIDNEPSTNNATGFSAVPAGHYNVMEGYVFGNYVNIWSATQSFTNQAYDRWTSSGFSAIYRCFTNSKGNGFSVRCLRD